MARNFTIKDPDAPATYRQNRAIFFASGLDVRDAGLTKGSASEVLNKMNHEDETVRISAVFALMDMDNVKGKDRVKVPQPRR